VLVAKDEAEPGLLLEYDIRAEGDLAGFKLEGEMRGGAAMPSYEF
jgi:hypothetical protein